MDDDPPTTACPPADAWELPRRPRSRLDDALLLGAIMLALGILWGADMADRARNTLGACIHRARWHVGLALVRVAEQIDRAGGRMLPDEPPPGTEDAHVADLLRAVTAADGVRPSRPLRSFNDLWAPRPTGNGHASRRQSGEM